MNNRFLGFLGIVKKSGNIIEGYNKCEEAIKKGIVSLVILTDGLSQNSLDKFNTYCTRYNVPKIENFPSEDINLTLGKKNIKVLCIKDTNLSEKLIEMWSSTNS